MHDTLVLLKGGHKTLVHGSSVSEIEDVVRLARVNQRQLDSLHEFVYLQSSDTDQAVNRIAVDPFAVVGIVAVS